MRKPAPNGAATLSDKTHLQLNDYCHNKQQTPWPTVTK